MSSGDTPTVRVAAWERADLELLERLVGDPAMMEHLGGPESPEKILDRQRRYELPDSEQYKILVDPGSEGIGWVGYWERDWQGDNVYEIGWAVLSMFQGRGIAGRATELVIDIARGNAIWQFMHAFPSVDNAPSNGICRKLGFELLGACEFEYPPGHAMECNDWRLDLLAPI